MVGRVEASGVSVRRDPGDTFIWLAVGMAIVGLAITFYVPRRRLWVKVTDSRTYLAGVAERTTRFGRELRFMGASLETLRTAAPGLERWLNLVFNVKTDDYQRTDLFPVMKINQFCQIPADNYPYHFLTSLFFRRDQPVALFKLTTSSQEWCGNTFKSITDDGVSFKEKFNSYWDGQGEGQRDLRRDVVLEDALSYTLRALKFEELPIFTLTVLDLQQTNKVTPPVYYAAQFRTTSATSQDVLEPAWRVVVTLAPEKENVYWFAKKYPNILLRQTTWDGRNLRLKATRRYAYWPK